MQKTQSLTDPKKIALAKLHLLFRFFYLFIHLFIIYLFIYLFISNRSCQDHLIFHRCISFFTYLPERSSVPRDWPVRHLYSTIKYFQYFLLLPSHPSCSHLRYAVILLPLIKQTQNESNPLVTTDRIHNNFSL